MNRLKKNDKAIPFKFDDYLGNEIDLLNYKGKKVMLTFFRDASCPFCNLRVNQLIKRHAEFKEKGIEIISFFASSKKEILKYVGKQKAPFTIIADPKLEMYKKYGIEESIAGMYKAMLKPLKMMEVMISGFFNMNSMKERALIPADFLIDENQTIYKVYYGKNFGDHLPIEEIINW